MKTLGIVTVFLIALGLLLPRHDAASASDRLFETMEILHVKHSPAPDFRLATPDGKAIARGQLRDKVVFLNFWATWRPPCREEMPSMERLHREFKDRGLAMVAVDVAESPKQVARFMAEFRLSFPALLDEDAEVAKRDAIPGLPTTYLIDRSGRVVGRADGPRDWATPEGRAVIRALLERRG